MTMPAQAPGLARYTLSDFIPGSAAGFLRRKTGPHGDRSSDRQTPNKNGRTRRPARLLKTGIDGRRDYARTTGL